MSSGTKLLASFYRKEGGKYLRAIIEPVVREVISKSDSWEVNPDKIDPEEAKANLDNLVKMTQQLLDRIISQQDECPDSFREIFQHASAEVAKKFPDLKTTIVGGFLFLRFFCPALVTPEAFGLIAEPPSSEIRRGLVLISKLLQSLANGAELESSKEAASIATAEFVGRNSENIQQLFENISVPLEDEKKLKKTVTMASIKDGVPLDSGDALLPIDEELTCIQNAVIAHREKVLEGLGKEDKEMATRLDDIIALLEKSKASKKNDTDVEKEKEKEEKRYRRPSIRLPRSPFKSTSSASSIFPSLTSKERRESDMAKVSAEGSNGDKELNEKLKGAEQTIAALKEKLNAESLHRGQLEKQLGMTSVETDAEIENLKSAVFAELCKFTDFVHKRRVQELDDVVKLQVELGELQKGFNTQKNNHRVELEQEHVKNKELSEELEKTKNQLRDASEDMQTTKKTNKELQEQLSKMRDELWKAQEEKKKLEEELVFLKNAKFSTEEEKKMAVLVQTLMKAHHEIKDLTLNAIERREKLETRTNFQNDDVKDKLKLRLKRQTSVEVLSKGPPKSPRSPRSPRSSPRSPREPTPLQKKRSGSGSSQVSSKSEDVSTSSVHTDETPTEQDTISDGSDDDSDSQQMDWAEFLRSEALKDKNPKKRMSWNNFLSKKLMNQRKGKNIGSI